MGKCIVCGSTDDRRQDDYCTSHSAAMRQMHAAYATWSEAYGAIRLEQFLARLSELPETGDRVKELVKFLARNLREWTD